MKTAPLGHSTMSSALPNAKNYHHWILTLMQPWLRGKVLEVGVGYGQYTPELAKCAQLVVGLDFDSACVAAIQTLGPKVRGLVGDLCDPGLPEVIGRDTFDVAVCLNVLEHLPDEMVALRSLYASLKPSGRLLIIVPAHAAVYGPMDSMAGHFRRYSSGLMRKRLQQAGFAVRTVRYFNPLGGLGWWLNAKLFRPRTLSDDHINRQILLFDRWLQPLSRLLDPLTRRFFGQSLWAVAERPAAPRS